VKRRHAIAIACGLVLGPAAGDASAAFTTDIDNPWLPLAAGNRWVYKETGQDGSVQRVVVKVTHRTKLIANGVTARVVRDTVSEEGEVIEDTFDWYAQDGRGNVWYLGEDTKEYENGKVVTTKGSWEAGVDGAVAGIIMPANPRRGMQYRQEYLKGEAEDKARVVSRFKNSVLTREWTPLEPGIFEYKLYARGVGTVLELTVPSGDREELVSFHRG
jgi:hypothetical protein